MRPSYSTITPTAVHHCVRSILRSTLQFQPHKQSVTLDQLLDLLLLVAATSRTLFAIVGRHFDFSHELGRRAIHGNLPTLDVLAERLTDTLHAVAAFSRRDRRRHWSVAIDTHNVPYYGCRSTPHIVGAQKKEGTKFFFSYATAVLIHRRRRFTVGLVPVGNGRKPHQLVKALLEQIRSRGLTVGGVALDAGFDSGETILMLQGWPVSYTVPLRRKGTGSNRRNDCFDAPSGTLKTVDWVTEKTRKPVSTRVLVWRRETEPRTRVYAFGGWGQGRGLSEARRAWLGRRRYRERFGIETSYRQKNQARGWTTSRRADYRLLLEGLALVVRQMWVRRTQQIANARGLPPKAWLGQFRLTDLLDWLTDTLKTHHPNTDPNYQAILILTIIPTR